MNLYIDVGNTRIKWWLGKNESELSFDELSAAVTHNKKFADAMREVAPHVVSVDSVWVSSVAGSNAQLEISAYCAEVWNVDAKFMVVERELGVVKLAYHDVSELGVDRCMAVIGARQAVKERSVIVVNVGTAITVDYLSSDNTFEGGAIMPGFDLAFASLNRTANIAQYDVKSYSSRSVGQTTEQCVALGVISACVGGVEKVVEGMKSFSVSPVVIVSGGASRLFLDATSLECKYDANIVIRGLIVLSQL